MEKIKKIKEHTYGTSIFMALEIDGEYFECTCYIRPSGTYYRTTADGTPNREKVVEAFNILY